MSYLIDIKEMLKIKSRVFIFIKENGEGHTTNIKEAGKWEEPQLSKMLNNKDLAYCKESSIKYLEKKDNNIVFNTLSKKYFQVA